VLWVTWRQHRLEGMWSFALVAVMVGCLSFVIWEAGHPGCPVGVNATFCLPDDALGMVAQQIMRLDLVQYGLVVLPALAGAFIGAPLVAREIENGTHRLAWTQGVTRVRWIFAKLSLLFVPLMLAAGLLGILEIILINAMGTLANHWAWFDQQAPLTVAATVFALALGVASGAVIGRSIPAMAVTLIGVVATRFTLAVIVRAHYMSPHLFSSHDPNALGDQLQMDPTAWWLDQPAYHDAGGNTITQADALRVSSTGNLSPADALAAYWKDHGISIVQYYQPGDRFWTFQTIESGILLVLTAVLLGFAVYWVTRRVS
jgi:ABC-type transport system involved in multi-copper enzyme maturation permease subunit